MLIMLFGMVIPVLSAAPFYVVNHRAQQAGLGRFPEMGSFPESCLPLAADELAEDQRS